MKKLGRFLLLVLIGLIGFIVYELYFTKDTTTEAINLVPEDAVYVLETKKPIKAWTRFSNSELWKHLKTYPDFKEITDNADMLDKTIEENQTLFSIFSLKNLIISAHVIPGKDYDFLFLTDLSRASRSSLVKNNLGRIFSLGDFKVSTIDYKGIEIRACKSKTDGSTLYVAVVANYLACSYQLAILKKSIDQYYEPTYSADKHFQLVKEETPSGGLTRVYVN